jgi:hypothetical protein
MANPRLSELFTIKEAANILNRTEYSTWHHTLKNVVPETMGYRKLLTKSMLRKIATDHLKLRDGEKLEDILQRIETAAAEK